MVYLNEHTDRIDIASALEKVSEQRRKLALKYRHESSRQLSLAAYLLLMEGLEKEYGINEPPLFNYTAEGKPVLVQHPDIHFNFSHSGTVALCALSNRPIGADVETPCEITPALIEYTMNANEQSIINTSTNHTMQFLHYWTRKEALLKLTAEGVRNDMRTVLAQVEEYQMETIQTENYIYSIAQYK